MWREWNVLDEAWQKPKIIDDFVKIMTMEIYRDSFLLATIAPCVFARFCKYGKWGGGVEESEEYINLSQMKKQN